MIEQQTNTFVRPRAGTPVIVDVLARSTSDGGVVFSHEWRWEDGTPGGSGAIDVPERAIDAAHTPIHFHLRDGTKPGRGLKFASDSVGPIRVKRDSCPGQDEKSDDPEIPLDQIVSSPKLLKVVDRNSERCTLHYRLRFTDRSEQFESYDPEITNGGTN